MYAADSTSNKNICACWPARTKQLLYLLLLSRSGIIPSLTSTQPVGPYRYTLGAMHACIPPSPPPLETGAIFLFSFSSIPASSLLLYCSIFTGKQLASCCYSYCISKLFFTHGQLSCLLACLTENQAVCVEQSLEEKIHIPWKLRGDHVEKKMRIFM